MFNIYQKLQQIQAKTGQISKTERNKFQNYRYFTEQQALNILKPLLTEQKLTLTFSDDDSHFACKKQEKDWAIQYRKKAILTNSEKPEEQLTFNFWACGQNTNCLHNKQIKFTNSVSQQIDSKIFITELFQDLKLSCQEAELKELFQQEHFHLIRSPYIKGKIERLVDNNYLELATLCQILLGKTPRLYGTLQKIKYTNLYLFKALIFDPNHLIYEETEFAKLKNMTCLFSENDCLATRELEEQRKTN